MNTTIIEVPMWVWGGAIFFVALFAFFATKLFRFMKLARSSAGVSLAGARKLLGLTLAIRLITFLASGFLAATFCRDLVTRFQTVSVQGQKLILICPISVWRYSIPIDSIRGTELRMNTGDEARLVVTIDTGAKFTSVSAPKPILEDVKKQIDVLVRK